MTSVRPGLTEAGYRNGAPGRPGFTRTLERLLRRTGARRKPPAAGGGATKPGHAANAGTPSSSGAGCGARGQRRPLFARPFGPANEGCHVAAAHGAAATCVPRARQGEAELRPHPVIVGRAPPPHICPGRKNQREKRRQHAVGQRNRKGRLQLALRLSSPDPGENMFSERRTALPRRAYNICGEQNPRTPDFLTG